MRINSSSTSHWFRGQCVLADKTPGWLYYLIRQWIYISRISVYLNFLNLFFTNLCMYAIRLWLFADLFFTNSTIHNLETVIKGNRNPMKSLCYQKSHYSSVNNDPCTSVKQTIHNMKHAKQWHHQLNGLVQEGLLKPHFITSKKS